MPLFSLHRRPVRPTLLIVGCGDVGLRVLRLLRGRYRVLALTSSVERVDSLRAAGAVPLLGNLDAPGTLGRLAGLADAVLHLAPPPSAGRSDPRTAALLAALGRGGGAPRLVYGSTTGVYGNAQGAFFDECRPPAPATDRAWRRVDAERRVREHARSHRARATVLRIPGIYALDRTGGSPVERVARGVPVLVPADDVHTNHIHADDLARACVAALVRGGNQRVVHVSDDSRLSMAEHYTEVARLAGLPAPRRITRAEAEATMSPMALSFLGESRQLDNRRLKNELRLRLRYPTTADALSAAGYRSSQAEAAGAALRPATA